LIFLGPHFHRAAPIEVKFCRNKRTQVPVGPAKFELNWCNESPCGGDKPDFWPVSKLNTGRLPLGGILPVAKTPHFRTYSRRVLCDLPQALHGDRARRAHQNGVIHFLIQRIVFPLEGKMLIFGY